MTSHDTDIDCGENCSAAVAVGTTVTLVAKPDPRSIFTHWSGCDRVAFRRCTVTMTSDRTVRATFVSLPHPFVLWLELLHGWF